MRFRISSIIRGILKSVSDCSGTKNTDFFISVIATFSIKIKEKRFSLKWLSIRLLDDDNNKFLKIRDLRCKIFSKIRGRIKFELNCWLGMINFRELYSRFESFVTEISINNKDKNETDSSNFKEIILFLLSLIYSGKRKLRKFKITVIHS